MPKMSDPPFSNAFHLFNEGRMPDAAALVQATLAGQPAGGQIPLMRTGQGLPAIPAAMTSLPWLPMQMPGGPMTGLMPARAGIDLGMLRLSFSDHNGSRDYRLHVPVGYTGEPVPLVVMLHGGTQSPEDFAIGTRMNELADRDTFLVAYPEQSRSANPNGYWNWFQPGDQVRDRGEPALIAGITRQIMSSQAVDVGSIFVAGLSAGGAMAATMAATYPDLFSGAGIHSGLAHGAAHDLGTAFAAMRTGGTPRPSAAAGCPLIVVHGGQDPTVAPVNADRIIASVVAAHPTVIETTQAVPVGRGGGGRSSTCTRYTNEDGDVLAEDWRVAGAGHAWAGGDPGGSYTDPAGPDASQEMLRFFGIPRATSW